MRTRPDTDSSSAGLKAADMVKSGNQQTMAIDRGAGIFESRGIGNSYLVTTAQGSVLINTGTLKEARRGKPLFNQVSGQPIDHIILTQSHANQFGGVEIYKTPDNQLISHRLYPQDREYTSMLNSHYRRGSRRIFGEITGSADDMLPTREFPSATCSARCSATTRTLTRCAATNLAAHWNSLTPSKRCVY